MSDSGFLQISPKIAVLPIIHGSGDCAVEVRRAMLARSFDCLAVPLPASFQLDVEQAVERLPMISLVLQRETPDFNTAYDPDRDEQDEQSDERSASFVPVDPCQGVIAALRIAMQERIPRKFIDLETSLWEPRAQVFPDPYALKQLSLEQFAAAVLPVIPRPPAGQAIDRLVAMAERLRELEQKYSSILLVCSLSDWPWIHEAYFDNRHTRAEDDLVEETEEFGVDQQTLLFLLGELPYITGLYERARSELDDDENLSVDGVKELLQSARLRYAAELKNRARKITPHLLKVYLKYVRNLSLIERRMTPDLYTLVVAAQQIMGDSYAISLAETVREYPFNADLMLPQVRMSQERCRLPDGTVLKLKSRLPGPPLIWRTCQLKPKPARSEQTRWENQWNPYAQCSWPPEDEIIERFRTRVTDKALSILGVDLARSEKFTTSLMDGLDIRETLRNWHKGDLYVKVNPPSRGKLDSVVMLFDYPADPRDFPWRTTWSAEHEEESTLAFFATRFEEELVGPGIGLATYGGAMFIFPPRYIPDVWHDPRLDFATTLEERLVAAACLHSKYPHVAILSMSPPGAGWRRMARKFGRKLIHVPLGHFSQQTIQQLRLVHVLNGKQIRSFAAEFIRKA